MERVPLNFVEQQDKLSKVLNIPRIKTYEMLPNPFLSQPKIIQESIPKSKKKKITFIWEREFII